MVNLETQYPGKVDPSSSAYPYGEPRNVSTPGDGTGTPWEAAWVKDIAGLLQAIVSKGGVVPNGNPDTALASQFLEAVEQITVGSLPFVNDLVGITGLDGVQINTANRTVLGDGGGGPLYWDSTIDKATANGITIIDPGKTLALQGTGIGLGCWDRRDKDIVNVKWGGAVGDGVADDTAVFTAVAAITNTAIVPITSVSYLISSSLVNTGTTFIFYGDSSQITGTVTVQQLKALFTDNGYIGGVPITDELRDKRIGIIAGTLRQNATTRSQWDWIKDSGHEPIGVDDSTPAIATGDTLTVNYDETYTKTLTITVSPDEALASSLGMSVGPSVGTTLMNIKASVDLTLACTIKYNGATWDVVYGDGQGGTGSHNVDISSVSQVSANITIDHDWIAGSDITLTAYTANGAVLPYIPVIRSFTDTQIVMNFIDYAGAFVTVADTSMSFVLTKNFSGGIDLDGTGNGDTLELNLGNIWFHGIMQF